MADWKAQVKDDAVQAYRHITEGGAYVRQAQIHLLDSDRAGKTEAKKSINSAMKALEKGEKILANVYDVLEREKEKPNTPEDKAFLKKWNMRDLGWIYWRVDRAKDRLEQVRDMLGKARWTPGLGRELGDIEDDLNKAIRVYEDMLIKVTGR